MKYGIFIKYTNKAILSMIIWLHYSVTYSAFLDKVVNPMIKGDEQSVDIVIQDYVEALLTFLYLIATIFVIWGAVKMFTAAGEEDQFNAGKKIIIFALIGIIVIFLAGPIVDIFIGDDGVGILREGFE